MTRQEAIQKAVLGVIAQGGPSIDIDAYGRGSCLYRGPNGRKCAAGQLLADEDVPGTGEFGDSLVMLPDVERMGLAQGDYFFVRRLQEDHDSCAVAHKGDDAAFLADYRERSLKTAAEYGLTLELPPLG